MMRQVELVHQPTLVLCRWWKGMGREPPAPILRGIPMVASRGLSFSCTQSKGLFRIGIMVTTTIPTATIQCGSSRRSQHLGASWWLLSMALVTIRMARITTSVTAAPTFGLARHHNHPGGFRRLPSSVDLCHLRGGSMAVEDEEHQDDEHEDEHETGGPDAVEDEDQAHPQPWAA